MKKNYKSKLLIALSFGLTMFYGNQATAQCAITGLADVYCLDAVPVVLAATPGGGVFSGPGVAGGIFDPVAAGVGTHTINYSYIPGTTKYYIKSNIGNPWGNTSNDVAMNLAFGPGGWTLQSFESAPVATVFSPSTSFVFLDGSDGHATELNAFLTANLATIEAWVDLGGSLIINSAPNEGGSFNLGFGGTTLVYSYYAGTVNVVDLAHPAYVGPHLPTSSSMSGSSYGHARITGTGYTTILNSSGNVILCEKPWGAGQVMMGGMTTVNFHSPSPHAANWRANLFEYMDALVTPIPCITSTTVTVIDEVSPDLVATSSADQICLGESYTLTGSGATDFYWGGGIVDGEPVTPAAAGTYTHILSGTSDAGCAGTDVVTVVVHPTPIVEAGLDISQCAGMEVTLSGSGAETYEWDPAVTDGVPFVVEDGATTYTVTGTDANGCEDTDEIVVTAIPYPVVTAVIEDEYALYGASIDITVTGGSGPFGYTWSHGPTTQDVSGLTEGTYTVTVDDIGVENGLCPTVEETYLIASFVGVEGLTLSELSVYPTPATNEVTIAFKGAFAYELTALNGDIISTGNGVDKKIVSIQDLAAGTYIINVKVDGKVNTVKIVKQ